VRLYWVPGHAGVRGNEIADRLARSGSGQRFIGSEPCLGVSRQLTRRKMKCWMKNQHLALWRGPCSAQRQARELISGPDLATGARLLSFNRTQTRAVIGLLTGHNTLRRHLHVMGLNDNPICRKRDNEEETSAHILCECEALASLRHTYLGSSFFWRTLRCWVWRPSGTLLKEQGSYNLVQNRGYRGPVLRPRCIGPGQGLYPIYHSILTLILHG